VIFEVNAPPARREAQRALRPALELAGPRNVISLISQYTLSELLAASDYGRPLTDEGREWVAGPVVGCELL